MDDRAKQIYDKHIRFAVLLSDNGMPFIVSSLIHKYYGGNKQQSLLEKLREDKCDNLIKKIQTVFPTYPPLHS